MSGLEKRLQRINLGFVLVLAVVAVALLYWSVLRRGTILARDDNPRLVEMELQVERGTILDRNGTVLAETLRTGELGTGAAGKGIFRRYPAPGGPAVGFYSLRHGVAGIEASYDAELRGLPSSEWLAIWNRLLHINPVGRDVQLTLDSGLQRLAEKEMGERAGVVVLLSASSGEVLVMASQPGYDPNRLEEQFEMLNADAGSPLLNRAVQARYQPGGVLQPFVLAAAIESGAVDSGTTWESMGDVVEVGGLQLACVQEPGREGTAGDALARECPAPFAEMSASLGGDGLVDGLAGFGFYEIPGMPLAMASPSDQPSDLGTMESVREAVGQGTLTASPLQMARALSAIANHGTLPALRLVARVGTPVGDWDLVIPDDEPAIGVISAESAMSVSRLMMSPGGPGDIDQDLAAHVGQAVAGPESTTNTWFIGFAPATAPEALPRYVVVVLLEASAERGAATDIGRRLLAAVSG